VKPSLPQPLSLGLACLLLALCPPHRALAQTNNPGVVDRTKTAVQRTGERIDAAATSVSDGFRGAASSIGDAGRSVTDGFKNMWTRVDEKRLKNRTRDEIVTWVIIGTLVGAIAGLFTSLPATFAGRIGRLLLGLVGAFFGGIVVHVAQIDFGWGPVLIRYEELLFALAGALLLVLLARVLRSRTQKPADK
jgi:uncharacterized membrane protein YeaQ/YmgE (transglycosylase-associated protein family)